MKISAAHPLSQTVFPLTTGEADWGGEIVRKLGRTKHWTLNTHVGKGHCLLPPSPALSATWKNHPLGHILPVEFSVQVFVVITSLLCPNSLLELPTKRNYSLGWFLHREAHQNPEWGFLKILMPAIHSGDAHPGGLTMKVLKLNLSIIDHLDALSVEKPQLRAYVSFLGLP